MAIAWGAAASDFATNFPTLRRQICAGPRSCDFLRRHCCRLGSFVGGRARNVHGGGTAASAGVSWLVPPGMVEVRRLSRDAVKRDPDCGPPSWRGLCRLVSTLRRGGRGTGYPAPVYSRPLSLVWMAWCGMQTARGLSSRAEDASSLNFGRSVAIFAASRRLRISVCLLLMVDDRGDQTSWTRLPRRGPDQAGVKPMAERRREVSTIANRRTNGR